MTPELVTYILTVSLGIIVGLALSAIIRSSYTQWLERKLAMARKELALLRKERQQPWLTGATTEYHLQKKIKELETECNRLYGIGQEYDARVKELEMSISAWESLYGAFPGGPAINYQGIKNEWFHKGYAKAIKFVDQLEASIANLVIDKTELEKTIEGLEHCLSEKIRCSHCGEDSKRGY